MLVISPISRAATHPTPLDLLQSPIPSLTRFVSKFLRCPAGDILHVNRIMVAGVRREQTVTAVQGVDRRFLLEE